MIDPEKQMEIDRAREHADLARMRFENAFNATLQRVAPDRLTTDALAAAGDRIDLLKQQLLQRLRHWPIVLGLGAVGLLAFWRPARTAVLYANRLAALAWTYQNLRRPKQ